MVSNDSTSPPPPKLVEMYEQLQLPEGWKVVSVKRSLDQYDQAWELREEDGEGMPVEIAVALQLRKANQRTEWMEEISRQHGLIIIGECPPKFEYVVRYVSIAGGEREVKFIPRYDGEKGVFIFEKPVTPEWAERGFLTNSFIDSSSNGELFGDFEDMDGSYASTQLLERMEAERDKFSGEEIESAIKLKLVYVPKSKPGVRMISFNLDRLGEGEVDSFFRHIGYDT